MNKRKIIGISITAVVLIAIVTAIVITTISGQFRYNEDGAVDILDALAIIKELVNR